VSGAGSSIEADLAKIHVADDMDAAQIERIKRQLAAHDSAGEHSL
jgi:hypothetical protein